ncbi:MAG: glycosyl hydrolase [Gammaproteobacteria bacterium]|nr:glycosyl hydrolase [Gammaproteobacteria bacterium]
MSKLYQRTMSLAGIDAAGLAVDDLRALVRQILEAGIHGIAFSPYVEGQGPGAPLGEKQIQERLDIVRPHVRWIRTFSCTDGNELIPGIAAASGLNTLVGAWIDDDLERNETELANAIQVCSDGHANILAIGNEVLLRGELTEDQLIAYIHRAKEALPEVDVGYVDAYFAFVDYPRVTEACDVLLANCYPFWEGCTAEHALLYMKEMYRRVLNVANGKKIIVSETGWPNIGTPVKGAEPSLKNAIKYFVDTYRWAEEDGVEIFYFSAFDEAWKVDAEGDVGAFWGLWDKDGNSKYT